MQAIPTKPRGFTLPELFTVLAIISVTAVLLFPVVDGVASAPARRERRQQIRCLSHLKQLGIAALAYAQDFDDTLPPVAQKVTGGRGIPAAGLSRSWLGAGFLDGLYDSTPDLTPFSLLWEYDGAKTTYSCPATQNDSGIGLFYRVNDLCDGAKLRDFINPGRTAMITDGNGMWLGFVVGHAYDPPRKTASPWTNPFAPAIDESTGDALTRHNSGAEYLFADGHVRWFKPEAVFFPSRDSMSKTHSDLQTGETIGPNPGGDMVYKGHEYAGTFHLR